jgi:hypothetical protein
MVDGVVVYFLLLLLFVGLSPLGEALVFTKMSLLVLIPFLFLFFFKDG